MDVNIETPYTAITDDIEVKVAPFYDEERSLPDQKVFIFLYAVEINNLGKQTLQLISRHWIIRNGRNEQQIVDGPGVLGEQPIIKPGDSFHYTSQCPLDTPTGNMRGHYTLRDAQGNDIKILIPAFFLRLQDTLSNMGNLYTPIN